MRETDIIHQLQKAFPDQIGDDAAILPCSNQNSYVITKDLLIQDTHFQLKTTSVKDLAHKSLHVNLSDIAAMGALPQAILLGLSLTQAQLALLPRYLDAFTTACKNTQVNIIGGDTTRSLHQFSISITAIGTIQSDAIKYRHLAKSGHCLAIAGHLGYAQLGLKALQTNRSGFHQFKQAQTRPYAKIQEGIWFSQQTSVQAMMDVSDGLWLDLHRLCQASGLSAHLAIEDLPLSDTFSQACESLELNPIHTVLEGGEDYSLLIAVSAKDYTKLALSFENKFNYPLIKLGELAAGRGVQLYKKGKKITLNLKPFYHFSS